MSQKFRLTASTVAAYFKHRCDRLFRWDSVETRHRGKAGIGWNVPREKRSHSRPGIALLMEAGDRFEIEELQDLLDEVGEEQVRHEGVAIEAGREQVQPMPMDAFLRLLKARPLPGYIAQPKIELAALPGAESSFLERFELDPEKICVGSARPDLLEILPPQDGEKIRLRVWDFKASQVARHEHFIQVAYYTFLLESALEAAGLADTFAVDTEIAVIRSHDGQDEFKLAPYRLAVAEFLRHRAPVLLATPAADAHYHVREKCAQCAYMDTCQDEADAHFDLSRIAYISSESKRKLQQAGIDTHRELSRLTPSTGRDLEALRVASHDLSVHLHRYIAAARALEDGHLRLLDQSTLLMPRWYDVRVVLSAEHEPVSNTCFALGLKSYEGWDEANNRPFGSEHVFISDGPEHEADLLLAFLRVFNPLLLRIHEANRAIAEQPIDADPRVAAANQSLEAAEQQLDAFKAEHPRLLKSNPQYEQLDAERERLKEAVKEAKAALKQAQRDANWELYKQQTRLHFYVYDRLDLFILKYLVERHLFDPNLELLAEIRTLVRLFPPESILPDAETFRTVPGTILTEVLRNLTALPIPYLYDLHTVSEMFQPQNAAGEDNGYRFIPRYGFGWRHSNQVAFERIHDVWNDQSFAPDPKKPPLSPGEIRDTIDRTVRDKLRATDSVIRRLEQQFGDGLRLRKEPFRLYDDFDPLGFQMLEALRVFTILEASLEEMAVKHLHTLPAEDRAARFECIRGLRYLPDLDEEDGSLWFSFDPQSRDAKFDGGDFNLVLTPEDEPERLLGDVDGALFDTSRWRHECYRVTLLAYDHTTSPPRLQLQPKSLEKLREKVDLAKLCVLDRLYIDYNSPKVLAVLQQLHAAPEQARHLHELIASGTVANWQPFIHNVAAVEALLKQQVARAGRDTESFLNAAQWRALRGVSQEPLTLIWGPPGTGKTYLLGHILLAYLLAAERQGRPMRLLVTAFTHHAINNLLKKVSDLAAQYDIDPARLTIVKAGGHSHAADALLPETVDTIDDEKTGDYLNQVAQCIVVGSTVWGVYKAMKKAGDLVQSWFDLILVDEASQMKLSDALIAFSAGKPEANVILAGDDRQLPPIIHGIYPEEHEHMLTSVFAFMRYRMEQRRERDSAVEQRLLFQLEDNFRMNEPLTAYPREALYGGRFFSSQPESRIVTDPPLPAATDDAIDFMLHPDRPVILCWYTAPVSFTARNSLEAGLVARLVARLGDILIDHHTGAVYDPERFAAEGIAILSPHRAQNSTIRAVLARDGFDGRRKPLPLVDTVDKLQGQERDVVLVSYGVADAEYAEAEADFLLSSNRFNVATTRPRQKLILFCSDAVLNLVPDDQRALLDSMLLKDFRRYCCQGPVQFTWPTSDYGDITLNIQWRAFDSPSLRITHHASRP